MSFAPPPASVSPRVTWQNAYASCFTGAAACVSTGGATIALAIADGPPGYPSRSGKFFDHALVYVITWSIAPCVTSQGSGPDCRVLNFVDATTGSNTFAIEISSTQPIVGL